MLNKKIEVDGQAFEVVAGHGLGAFLSWNEFKFVVFYPDGFAIEIKFLLLYGAVSFAQGEVDAETVCL